MTTRFEPDSQIYKQRQYEAGNSVENQNGTNGNAQYSPQSPYQVVEHNTSLWSRLGLKTKAITIAITLSTLPVIVIGVTAYYLTNKKVTNSVTSQQQAQALGLANEIGHFTLERYKDIQTIAQLSIFDDPNVRASTSDREKQAVLDQYLGKGYGSIAVTDLVGRTIYQSTGGQANANLPQNYFQQAIKSNRPVITSPIKTGNDYGIFVAAPIVDTFTHRAVGVVRSRIPLSYLDQLIQPEVKNLAEANNSSGTYQDLATDNTGKIFGATVTNYVGQDLNSVFPAVAAQLPKANAVGSVTDTNQIDHKEYTVSYAPVGIEGLPALNWSAIVAHPTAAAFAASRRLVWVLAVGTVLEALLVGAIAAYLVNRGLRPLLKATNAVQKLGQGQLDTRLAIKGQDELAVLGSNINLMANQLQTLLVKQDAEAELAKLFADITLRVRQSLNLGDILKTAVREARTVLQADRVVIYQFKPDWSGIVVAESVMPGWTQTLGEDIDDLCFKEYVSNYKNGRVRAIDNIYKEGLTECYLRLLERFQVKANLVAPIQIEGRLLGLLIAHQCSAPRVWQQAEIDLFAQFAMQVGFAIDQASLLEQVEQARASAEATSSEQRQQKENLQRQLMALLGDIEGAAKGDLTVRAEVTAGEIGT
ncbi:MAG: GAF domain-containing protein, partial [Chroococcidiopsidaceae cyanobacterium CP_BM_RX_35]|nr:GAF domain-containing protein [Chroococcidiopsidaceae cyanobacterium CP_BM_RX_35]